jgi:hypothetical protein
VRRDDETAMWLGSIRSTASSRSHRSHNFPPHSIILSLLWGPKHSWDFRNESNEAGVVLCQIFKHDSWPRPFILPSLNNVGLYCTIHYQAMCLHIPSSILYLFSSIYITYWSPCGTCFIMVLLACDSVNLLILPHVCFKDISGS